MDNFTTDPFSPYITLESNSSFISNMSLLQHQHAMAGLPPLPETLQFPDNNIFEQLMFPAPPSPLIPNPIPYFQFRPPSQASYQLSNLQFLPPYEAPYPTPSMHFPYMDGTNTIPLVTNQAYNNEYNPLLPFLVEHQYNANVPFSMQDYQLEDFSQPLDLEQPQLQKKDEKELVATLTKTGRGKRREKNKKRIRKVFNAPDGKKLLEIFTKTLKKSDVGKHMRIVLPKKKAEAKLPQQSESKVATTIVLRDVYSEHQWALRYRYWSNNKSRMYVLEGVGDFVMHYGLKKGDYITLYQEESNVQENRYQMMTKDVHPIYYVKIKKEGYTEAMEPSSKAKDGEEESTSTEEMSSDEMEKGGDGSSSDGGEDVRSEQLENMEGVWNWEARAEEAKEDAKTWMRLQAPMIGDDLIVYGELDNILDVGGRFSPF